MSQNVFCVEGGSQSRTTKKDPSNDYCEGEFKSFVERTMVKCAKDFVREKSCLLYTSRCV